MSAPEAPLAVLWRTKLRSSLEGVDHERQVEHCLQNDLVGIGWGLADLPSGSKLEQVLETVEKSPWSGWGRPAAMTIRRLAEQAQVGDFIWTRDTHGRYWLGQIDGPYRYDNSPDAKAVDVHQVRPTQWAPRPLNDLEVPGAVIRSFVGTSSSFSRVHDPGARRLTPVIWAQLHGASPPPFEATALEVLTSFLDPQDVEDLVYLWLQVARGYLAWPRSRQRDTPAYEWTMIARDGRERAIVQVKTGGEPVDLKALSEAAVDRQTATYAFATSEQYVGDPALVTEIVGIDALLAFVDEHGDLLPERVAAWFALVDDRG